MSEAQRYLMSIKDYEKLIDGKIRERDMLQAYVTRTTTTIKQDVVSGGKQEDDSKERLIDLKNELDQLIAHTDKLKEEAFRLLEKLRAVDEDFYDVLHKRYVLYESLTNIALEWPCTYRNICYIHGNALQEFNKILQESEKAGG